MSAGPDVSIPGRRERKKLAARAAILDASRDLFVERGFEATRIEAIAQRADVAVGSVYNHFETKADILVAMLFADAADVIGRSHAIVERGGPDAATVLRATVEVLFDVMDRRSRDLWRDLIGHALLDSQTLGIAYRGVESQLRHVVRTGLLRLRERGHSRSDVPIDDAVDIVFAIAKVAVYTFVFEAPIEADAVLDKLERQIGAIF